MNDGPFSVAAFREFAFLAERDDLVERNLTGGTTYAWRMRYAIDVPALCDEIDRLREEFERLRAAVKRAEVDGAVEPHVVCRLLGEK